MRTLVAAGALSLVLLPGLAACGSDKSNTASDNTTPSTSSTDSVSPTAGPSSPTPTDSPTTPSAEPTGTACSDVWVAGQRLPGSYDGCVNSTGYVKADKLGCSSGQKLVRYAPHFWTVAGGEIHRTANLNRDPDYRAAIKSCRG